MRITLVISSLWGGGAERVASVLANGWAEQGHGVSILTFEHGDGPTYPIDASVRVRHLDLLRASRHRWQGVIENMRRIRVLRRAIRDSGPEIIVSLMDRTNVLTLLASRGLGNAVVICEQVDPLHWDIGPVWNTLRRWVYPFANALVCPTAAALGRFQAKTAVRGVAIPNVLQVPGAPGEGPGGLHSRGPVLIAMGRLVPQKGFDLLLDAFARVAGLHPDWSLIIIGKGPLRSDLERQSRSLGISERVHFAGELADPFPVLRAADLFVFSSRFEGFGMALAEAMACGLPVISFDCPEGPRDIVRDGIDGVLVPPEDVVALANAMHRLMSDGQRRAKLAARALEVTDRFSRQRILSLWQRLFSELLSTQGVSRSGR